MALGEKPKNYPEPEAKAHASYNGVRASFIRTLLDPISTPPLSHLLLPFQPLALLFRFTSAAAAPQIFPPISPRARGRSADQRVGEASASDFSGSCRWIVAVLAGGFLISLSTFQYAPVPVLDGFAWCGGRTAVRFGDFVFCFLVA